MNVQNPPPRSGPSIPLIFALVTLAIYALTRIGLALWTGQDAVPLVAWPAVLAEGLWFDLAVLTALLVPVWQGALKDPAVALHAP